MQKKAVLILLAVGFIIYGSSLGNRFLLDDESQVLQNELIHSPGNILTFFLGSTMNQEGAALGGIYYKPIMSLCYSLLWWASPDSPLIYHLFQLLIAIANAFLLWRLLRRHMDEKLALLMALIFLAHPLNAEVVVYIADLQDVLYMFFGLAALNYLADGRWWAMTLLLGASLLSKESGVLYLVTAVVYAAVFKREVWKRVAGISGGVMAIYAFLRFGVAHLTTLTHSQNQIGRADLDVRLLTAPKALASYLIKFVFPRDITATQDWVVATASWSDFWMPLILALSVLVISVWYAVRYWRQTGGSLTFAFFVFWVFMGMGFHSHILISLDGTVADRWFYFSSVGLIAILGLFIERSAWLDFPKMVTAIFIFWIVGLSARSYIRSLDWYDNFTLCYHDLQIFPDSYDMHNNLGVEYFRRGQVEDAEKEFRRSVDLAPGWDINWNNLGATYNRLGDTQKAEASYLKSMEHGTYYMAYENYATILVQEGRVEEAKTFIREKALPMFPASKTLQTLWNLLNK